MKRNNTFIKGSIWKNILTIFLLLVIAVGVSTRFYKVAWDSDGLLHPDEYGFTNTLSRLQLPSSISEYFNTRISPISPYNKYDVNGEKTEDGPDNGMRWGQLPMLMIRTAAEATGQTGYIEIRRTGRILSAIMDTLSLLILFMIAQKLFHDRMIGLTAAAFGSMAVMEIQQSHFMTVDNFGVFFTMLTLYTSVCIGVDKNVIIRKKTLQYGLSRQGWLLFALFGLFLGMTIACKVNLAILGLTLAPAGFLAAADLPCKAKSDFSRILSLVITGVLTSIIVMMFSIRIFQPMAFRAPSGNTSFFTWHINSDWWNCMMVSASESSGIGSGPPGEQWAHRLPIIFPFVNMIFYGMGFPLGFAVWAAVICAWIKIFRHRCIENLKQLLIPVFWATFFFLFMGTRFVKSTRYFLPIYPMLFLLAAWMFVTWFQHSSKKRLSRAFSILTAGIVLCGTGIWAGTFVRTIYGQDHSRVEATKWMFSEIPSMFHLRGLDTETNTSAGVPVSSASEEILYKGNTFEQAFSPNVNLAVDSMIIPHLSIIAPEGTDTELKIEILRNSLPISSTLVRIPDSGEEQAVSVSLNSCHLEKDNVYVLRVTMMTDGVLQARRTVIANENWDESLPIRLNGYDPFGQFYDGVMNEVRWYDSDSKREMFIETLEKADYIILPSQRAIWSVCRIPKTYPMTMAYYEALFDGSLGFKLTASFQRPFYILGLTISDLAGTISTEKNPILPIVNRSIWSAEEAFSVYDHPPVWIFKKTEAYSKEKSEAFFNQFDLSTVVVQSPPDAEW